MKRNAETGCLATRAASLLIAFAASTCIAGERGVELTGRILDAAGRPLPGATVAIYTAQPRVGIGSVCPSCYPECRKSRVTDARGRFAIPGLNDQLLYRLLVVADGFVPEFVDRVDPKAGRIEPKMKRRPATPDSGLRTLVGHVVDPHGQPVAGASVTPRGIHVGDRTSFGSPLVWGPRVDPLAISHANGEFRLTGPDSIETWVLLVVARGLSSRVFANVKAGDPAPLLKLETGATVTGLVTREARPVSGAGIGIAQEDRSAFNYVPEDTIAADENGRFTFSNVPANQDYSFSGVIESLKPWALRTVIRTVGENDSTTRLPDLELERGFSLSGRVLLSDGQSVPDGTELILSRERSMSYVQLPMDADGRFRMEGIPPETIVLHLRMKGYRIRPDTPGYLGRSMGGVRLAMLRDRDDVEIVLEPTPEAAVARPPRP